MKSIINVAVRRPIAVSMMVLAVILFGLVSLSQLSLTLLPELTYPSLTIRTEYTGAAPAEVEQLVSKPIEETIGTVKGIRKIHSISKSGSSDVVIEFEWGTKMDNASIEIREKLDIVALPLDVEKPVILRFNPNLEPIVRLALTTEETTISTRDLEQLRIYAEETLKRRLETLPGVASVKLGGGLEQEIQVNIDSEKAALLNISIEQISQILRAENINSSGGQLKTDHQQLLIRTINQFQNIDEIKQLYVAKIGDTQVQLDDIATVSMGYKDRTSITRLDGQEAIELALYKEGDANTVNVANTIRTTMESLNENLPEGFHLTLVYDQSTFIEGAISEVKSGAIIGGLLAMLVIFLFLKQAGPTFIISLSIPVSVIATFNLLYGADISLNIMSLGGLALAVGLLVDNAIVVLENIARKREQGQNNTQAAVEGASDVASAIFASTLTTMAVFLPLAFVTGIAGQLFSDQALTVTFALLASLLVALTLIPTLSGRAASTLGNTEGMPAFSPLWQTPNKAWKLPFALLRTLSLLIVRTLPFSIIWVISQFIRIIAWLLSQLFRPLTFTTDVALKLFQNAYASLLHIALKQRLITAAVIVTLTSSSVLLLPKLGVELIPTMSQQEFYVEVKLPPGNAIEVTDHRLNQIASFLAEQTGVKHVQALSGTGSLMTTTAEQGGDHWGRLTVFLNEHADKTTKATISTALRQYAQKIPDITYHIKDPELFSLDSPIEIVLTGYDLDDLQAASNQLVAVLQNNSRFADVRATLQPGLPEATIVFDHARLSHLGLNAADVSKIIANNVAGDVATQYSMQDRKIDIRVRAQENRRDQLSDIAQLNISNNETEIPLSAVAHVSLKRGPSEITRVSQERVALVRANLAYGDLGQGLTAAEISLQQVKFPFGILGHVSGQNEAMQSSFQSLQLALLLAVFLVYIVMASQFESLLHPLLILFSVPLAAAGSLLGLYITGTNISIIVFIGLIMLAGIVVNNAIVLIDRINQLRAQGNTIHTAITNAANSRLRPILMTTLTTTLGLLPLAISVGEGSEMRMPMAVTVIFGLIFATLLTLIFIPVLYSLTARENTQYTPEETYE